ncbi:MAG: glycosyltransferase [Bacteroidales bacterium]|nr:glycosyltransferase [Bacteroidales bacterium]
MLIFPVIILSLIIALCYYLLVVFLTYGWLNTKTFSVSEKIPLEKISILLPFRNEAKNLENVIKDLLNQDYPSDLFEIIAINDHSEDDFIKVFEKFGGKKIKLINLSEEESGKKQAIIKGLKASNFSTIASVDADCRYTKKWLKTMVQFQIQMNADLVFAPVDFYGGSSFFGKLQNLEFLSLIGSGAGAAGIGNPIFCNGANLIYKKEFAENKNSFQESIPSGDDVFLLQSIKKKKGKINFLKSFEAISYTKPPNNLKEFVTQRKRWSSKAKNYKDSDSILVSIIVFLNSFLLISLSIAGIFSELFLNVFILLFVLKSLVDLIFFIPVLTFFKKQKLLIWFIPLQILYIIYVVFIGLFGTFGKNRWKGRTV